MKSFKLLVAAAGIATVAAGAGNAFANTAANTRIVNSAKLTYAGGSAAASVVVSVALVPSTPNVTISYGNADYTAPNTPGIVDTVTITATANGPAEYTVTPSIMEATNVVSNSPSVNALTPKVTVGATVTTGTSGTTFVTVPAGIATGSGSAVNGIGVGSTIIFAAGGTNYTRTVTATTDNGDGTFTISWATPVGAAPAAGTLVAEQKAVSLDVLPGTVLSPGTSITVSVRASVSTPGAGAATADTASPNTWTTTSPYVSITKYVRNVTSKVAGTAGATTFTVNTVSNTYYTDGVVGKPGEVLEYVVQATNTSTTTDLSSSALSDVVPTAYVDLVTPGPYGGQDVFYVDPDNAPFTFTAAAVGANQASWVPASNPNLVVNVGRGAGKTATGTIPATKSVTIAYQVKIK